MAPWWDVLAIDLRMLVLLTSGLSIGNPSWEKNLLQPGCKPPHKNKDRPHLQVHQITFAAGLQQIFFP
jgi:hypothetical protein